jgi:ribosomal protein L20
MRWIAGVRHRRAIPPPSTDCGTSVEPRTITVMEQRTMFVGDRMKVLRHGIERAQQAGYAVRYREDTQASLSGWWVTRADQALFQPGEVERIIATIRERGVE